ncbi:uncharacterized protein LOC122648159 [Telopea speciosissima]|uniref:uncharacterized protein LOC122648159 n=1 Tax=Telopea speciosissima TaxID=54955 RepID=UPI001CC6AD66|nr:uncharacterized protein LOC122648159 [Telopea speciosissima]
MENEKEVIEGLEKVAIGEATMEEEKEVVAEESHLKHSKTVDLLRKFLAVQQRRAEAYAKLRRGFSEYMGGGSDVAYQQLCSEITVEFNDCSKQALEMESQFLNPDFCRDDLARLLRDVQTQEKQKLHLTATIQILKKAGRPSERLVTHEHCRSSNPAKHECVHVHEITEAAGTEDAEADAEYDSALNEAIRGVQDAVTNINEHLEEVRYEIEALEAE